MSCRLDGREVPVITAFLFHAGGHDDPFELAANAGKSFIGSYVLGMGFTFDDGNPGATPIAEMRRLIEHDPRNAERIFPYIGGQEINTSPTHAHHRFVINFGEMSEAEARQWPDLMAIVEAKVKPERMKQKREIRKRHWWRFGETTPALFRAIQGLERVLVCCLVSNKVQFAFLPNRMVYSHRLAVFPFEHHGPFCVLQSNVHEVWARFFSSSMKDDINYSPSDCFETFPFPIPLSSLRASATPRLCVETSSPSPIPLSSLRASAPPRLCVETSSPSPPSALKNPASTLEATGKAYYDFRADLMIRNDEGLTKTYNRFHDPDERDPDILRLRELHAAMDRAVLDAYGWDDVPTDCEFLLDYEIDEETWGNKKKPYRFRWPEEVHDEVLARLLDLNQTRYREEVAAGLHAKRKRSTQRRGGAGAQRKKEGRGRKDTGSLSLFPEEES